MRTFQTLTLGAALCACLASHTSLWARTVPLREAVLQALENNPELRVRRFDVQIASGHLTRAYGSFDPELRYAHTLNDDRTPLQLDPFLTPFRRDDTKSMSLTGRTPWGLSYELSGQQGRTDSAAAQVARDTRSFAGLTLRQPLLRGFGLAPSLEGVRVAKASRRIAQWQLEVGALQTVAACMNTYNDLLEARESLRITQTYREDLRRLLDDNRRRHEVGTLAEADVANAEARVAKVEETLVSAERYVRDTENRLRRLLGEQRFSHAEELLPEPLPRAVPRVVEPSADLADALDRRPDLKAARAGVERTRIEQAAARSQLLPQVDLVGTYGRVGVAPRSSDSVDRLRERRDDTRSVGVVVSIPLVHAAARGQARAAAATVHRQREELRGLEADAALALANATGQLEATRQRVDASRRAHTLALRSLEAEQKRLRSGTGNTFFVLQQQGEVADSENRLVRALADERRAHISYLRERALLLEAYDISLE